MRVLAVARYRFWTLLRSAGPIFAIAAAPPIIGALMEMSSHHLLDPDPMLFSAQATFALFTWLFHSAILLGASEMFGNVKALRPDLTSAISDLMDSAPVQPRIRFAGEWLGILGTTAMIHVCCLPALTMTAALCPLRRSVFVSIEVVLILLVILASASAAWKRVSPRTKWSGTRGARSGLLFIMFAFLIIAGTTSQPAFKNALGAYIGSPSVRKWQAVSASVDNPSLLLFLMAMLYFAYLAYFYVIGTRDRVALGDIG